MSGSSPIRRAEPARDKAAGRLLQASALHFCNSVGAKELVTLGSLETGISMEIKGRSAVLQFTNDDRTFKMQLRFKDFLGQWGLQSNAQTGRVSLVLPVRVPGRIMRLKLDAPEQVGRFWDDAREVWDRVCTVGSAVPSAMVGSSFVYRLCLVHTLAELRSAHKDVLDQLGRFRLLPNSLHAAMDLRCGRLADDAPEADDLADSLPFKVRYNLECLLSHGQAPCGSCCGSERAREVLGSCMLVRRVVITPTRLACLPEEVETSNRVTRHFARQSECFLRLTFGEENGDKLCYAADGVELGPVVERNKGVMQHGITIAGRHFEFLAYSSSQLKEQACWFFSATPDTTAADVRRFMGSFLGIRTVGKAAARMGQCFSSTFDTLQVQPGSTSTVPDIKRNGFTFSDGVGQISPALMAAVLAHLVELGRTVPQAPVTALQIRFRGAKGMVTLCPHLHGLQLNTRPSMEKFETEHDWLEVVKLARWLPGYLNRQIIMLLLDSCGRGGVPDHVFEELQGAMLAILNSMLHDSDAALEVLAKYGGAEEGVLRCMHDMITAGCDMQREPHLEGLLAAVRAQLLQELKHKTRIFVPQAAILMGVMDEHGVLQYGEVFLQVQRPTDTEATVITGLVLVSKNPCLHPGDVRKLMAVDRPELQHLVNVLIFPQLGTRPHPNEIGGGDLDGDQYFVSWDPRLIPARPNAAAMDYSPPPPLGAPGSSPGLLEQVTQILARSAAFNCGSAAFNCGSPEPAGNTDRAMGSSSEETQLEELIDLFVRFPQNDILGKLCSAHLALADQSPTGVADPACILLAQQASLAVDFAKTGVPASWPAGLHVRAYPDYMAAKHREQYESGTIIGRLFRKIEVPKPPQSGLLLAEAAATSAAQAGHTADDQPLAWVYDVDLDFDNEDWLDEAHSERLEYESELVKIMNQFGVLSEAQLVSGCIHKFSKLLKRKQFDVRQQVLEAVRGLRAATLRAFEEDVAYWVGGDSTDPEELARQTATARLAKASAWYRVTYHPDFAGLGSTSPHADQAQLLSFPWVAHKYLAQLKRVNAHHSQ
ncbi:hypothetical protein WJX72_004281 [[Myrmecia] bisecta]|uniref:RNA-dependent RNA polymerase n=1 Tax=[Myrmecia] bisecta TaxID=41462 RepID=A0AAW1Q6Z0_9CHLO